MGNLDRATRVSLSLRGEIGGMRAFRSVETPEADLLSAHLDSSAEFVVHRAHAEESGLASGRRLPSILQINGASCSAEIGPRIVRPDTVQMVNVVGRPLAGLPKDSEPMGSVVLAIKADSDVPKIVDCPSSRSGCGPSNCPLPSEDAGRFVVVEDFSKSHLRKHGAIV